MLRFLTATCCLQTAAMLDRRRLALPALHPAILDRIIPAFDPKQQLIKCAAAAGCQQLLLAASGPGLLPLAGPG